MNIIRKLDLTKAVYDITELTNEEFKRIIWSIEVDGENRNICPDEDELLNKLHKMEEGNTLKIE